MAPGLRDGDLVVATAFAPGHSPDVGHVVHIRHPVLGSVVKRIHERRGAGFVVGGDSIASTSRDDLGLIDPSWIIARVRFPLRIRARR